MAAKASPFPTPIARQDQNDQVVSQRVATLERVGQVHNFAKGMGLAAPRPTGSVVAGMPVADAIDAAQSAAAWTVGHSGGREAMPSPGSAL